MFPERLTDERKVDPRKVQKLIDDGKGVIVQYSKACYTEATLRGINELCEEHGEKIEVRFYGHVFDADLLRHLPAATGLCLDFQRGPVPGLDTLFTLPRLRSLALIVDGLERPEVLGADNLKSLTYLRVGGKSKKKIDLSPVSQMTSLKQLSTGNDVRNLEAIGSIPSLEILGLRSVPKTVRLDFLSVLRRLRILYLASCGQPDLDGMVLPALEHLEIYGMRSLTVLRPDAFPALQALQLEALSHLESLDFTGGSEALRDVKLINCKALKSLTGLGGLKGLHQIRVSRTMLDVDAILKKPLPKSLKIFAFYAKGEKAIRAKLDARGYAES